MDEKIRISDIANKALHAWLNNKITDDECNKIHDEMQLRMLIINLKEGRKWLVSETKSN